MATESAEPKHRVLPVQSHTYLAGPSTAPPFGLARVRICLEISCLILVLAVCGSAVARAPDLLLDNTSLSKLDCGCAYDHTILTVPG